METEERYETSTEAGRAVVVADPGFGPTATLVEACLVWTKRQSGVRLDSDAGPLALKGGPLASAGVRRHGMRRWLIAAPAPCESERQNLTWLGQRLFRAAVPVASVTISRLGAPRRQLLATRWVEGARPFADVWRDAAGERRRELAAEVGREVGRMHALHFLHGDLYPRNALVTEAAEVGGPGHGRRIVWLDAWAGGPTAWRRGRFRPLESDLGAWFSSAADWMDRRSQRVLLDEYFAARNANGRPVASERSFLEGVKQARRDELARLEREPRRLRGAPFPVAGWDPPGQAGQAGQPGQRGPSGQSGQPVQ